jgi:hypothetical protein
MITVWHLVALNVINGDCMHTKKGATIVAPLVDAMWIG